MQKGSLFLRMVQRFESGDIDMQEFIKNFTPVLITAMVSLVAVFITQYKTKRLAFFQVFFSKKLEIYALFWKAVSDYEAEQSRENYARLETELHRVCLLAPENVYRLALVYLEHYRLGNGFQVIKLAAW